MNLDSVGSSSALPLPPGAWPLHATRVTAAEDLSRIDDQRLTLLAWPLSVPASDRAALGALATSVPPFTFAKETSPAGEALEFALPWMEGHAGGQVWLRQARQLVELFADLFEADRLGARLSLTDSAMCPRFHVDRVVCRLVVALSGPGSEFLADDDVRRASLGANHETPVERPGAQIHRLEPLEVGLFKGEAWPGFKGRGIVHRSPPTAERRLVMTLDLL